ncbi:MAG: hypothetical protein LBH46_01745 [Rickettsiales bacterium]|nr:hypothetical protein [Rickettsiales bacterium]
MKSYVTENKKKLYNKDDIFSFKVDHIILPNFFMKMVDEKDLSKLEDIIDSYNEKRKKKKLTGGNYVSN